MALVHAGEHNGIKSVRVRAIWALIYALPLGPGSHGFVQASIKISLLVWSSAILLQHNMMPFARSTRPNHCINAGDEFVVPEIQRSFNSNFALVEVLRLKPVTLAPTKQMYPFLRVSSPS
jgi:hypothetical protein